MYLRTLSILRYFYTKWFLSNILLFFWVWCYWWCNSILFWIYNNNGTTVLFKPQAINRTESFENHLINIYWMLYANFSFSHTFRFFVNCSIFFVHSFKSCSFVARPTMLLLHSFVCPTHVNIDVMCIFKTVSKHLLITKTYYAAAESRKSRSVLRHACWRR